MLDLIYSKFNYPKDVVEQFLEFTLIVPIIWAMICCLFLKKSTDKRSCEIKNSKIKCHEDIISIIRENKEEGNAKRSRRKIIITLVISSAIFVVQFFAGHIIFLKGGDLPIALIGLLPSVIGIGIVYLCIKRFKPDIPSQYIDLKYRNKERGGNE
ncbi:MAG: hypothetical protein HQK95_02305 [Nitrospirae bacterium]|nr:hypothetical protein [Nitrospirota bacterium]